MGRVVGDVGALRERILKQAREQAAEILDRARRVSERDLVYAGEEAQEIREQQRSKVDPTAEIEGRKALVDAEMEARRILLEKKDELVSRIFAQVESKLEELRGSETYVDIVTRLIEESVVSIGTKAMVEFGEGDRDIFTPEAISLMESRIAKSLEMEPRLEFRCVGSDISSGVIIKSRNGRVIIDNSFSNRIRRLKEELRGEVAEMLLEE